MNIEEWMSEIEVSLYLAHKRYQEKNRAIIKTLLNATTHMLVNDMKCPERMVSKCFNRDDIEDIVGCLRVNECLYNVVDVSVSENSDGS